MAYRNCIFILILFVICVNFGKCAEFVPVYMWQTSKLTERVPALHKTSEDSFKDTLLEYLKKDPYILVFAERTLSPEDFAQRDQNGDIAFPNILELKSETHATYKPYVQNPIGAVKQLGRPVTEISIGSLLNTPNVPEDNILIIDLNDARDDEQRFRMLKRHDSDIVTIYKDFLEQHKNILVIYTAYHTSWVAPEEVTQKKFRNLLAEEAPANKTPVVFSQASEFLIYLSDAGSINTTSGSTPLDGTFTSSIATKDAHSLISLVKDSISIDLNVTTNNKGYWYVNYVHLTEGSDNKTQFTTSSMYAPVRFSYHCGDLILQNAVTKTNLSLPGFQIQIFNKSDTSNNGSRFGDAYDCVGFTSVPIWSALFVTAILLFIMTFGLTMMMDIKTMDRFDDAKGKTITINATD